MALNIPTYPNPYDNNNPLTNAYAWIVGLGLDIPHNSGRVTFNIHPNENAWQSNPISQVSFSLGQNLVPASGTNPAITFPRLDELMGSSTQYGPSHVTFAEAYAVIGQVLYTCSLSAPVFEGATPA